MINKDGILRPAKSEDLIKSVNYYHKSIGAPKEWLNGYVGNLIERGEFFLFEDGEEIFGEKIKLVWKEAYRKLGSANLDR